MTAFLQRMTGAALLKPAIYEEVEADRSATIQAIGVVLMSSLGTGIGVLVPLRAGPMAFVGITLLAFAAWTAWALLTLEVGTRIFGSPETRADMGQLLRTLGFASTPGILRVAGLVPGIAMPVFAVTALWMLIAMIVAVRQALDYQTTSRAVAVCLLGFVLATSLAFGIGIIFSPALY